MPRSKKRTEQMVNQGREGGLRIALKWHPDKVEASKRDEAGDRFKRIKEAYEVLIDGIHPRRIIQADRQWTGEKSMTSTVRPITFARLMIRCCISRTRVPCAS
jgi:curved DNA-binding protein CbpA